jgi:hypothetical protein
MILYFINKIVISIYNIFNVIKTSLIWVLLDDYLQRNYKIEYDNFKIQISFQFVYYFSKIQLFCIKMKNKLSIIINNNDNLKNILDTINNKSKIDNNKIEIIQFKNGNLHIKKYTNENQGYFDDDNNSLYIFSVNENNFTNYIISRGQKIPEKHEVSNTKFIMVELQLNDSKFKIDLHTETQNYYNVENILDKDFFLYYMFINLHNYKEITYDDVLDSIENGIVKIIDENVNSLEIHFNKNENITILKNGFNVNSSS